MLTITFTEKSMASTKELKELNRFIDPTVELNNVLFHSNSKFYQLILRQIKNKKVTYKY
jgi:hypothetical protein